MDLSNIFRIINLCVGAIMVFGGISQFFPVSIGSVIIGVYVILFGLVVGALEFAPNPPSYLSRYASFLFSFLGRGLLYVFIGSILIEGHTLRIIAGTAVGFAGLGYAVLEFVPSIEAPSTMREADATWGAEQV
ncbi:hypothetical protein PAAG_11477 [Paracoccidioides lutzii Pb01]|uniref:COPI-coated vesicle protein n=2 Tax=Paracoccidioides TaxID=38946 RepID=A0A0A2V2R1_PARBA|nr:hypothetical protein PAAG_11477 [Paracoccidioides lutzii Pb01]KGQ01758.1 hypothetical protein PAAG_11477 [Paracoccidioides lutzii Pb01]ODH12653.1 hypothetical protein ACO22_08051 [Paracoccidioides brasiliensis]ODH49857.1 hypothetical protein GX48_04086 [Paracoccidioides brasiliensis]